MALRSKQVSVKSMTPEEKERYIEELQQQFKHESDIKKKNAIQSKIYYTKHADQKRKKRKQRYIEQHKDTIQQKCQEQLHALANLNSIKN